MQVAKTIIERVTLDETDLVQAVLLLMREKGYQIKAEQIEIDPKNITAVCTIQNTESDEKKSN